MTRKRTFARWRSGRGNGLLLLLMLLLLLLLLLLLSLSLLLFFGAFVIEIVKFSFRRYPDWGLNHKVNYHKIELIVQPYTPDVTNNGAK